LIKNFVCSVRNERKFPTIVTPAHPGSGPWTGTGVRNHLKTLDSGFRRNDGTDEFRTSKKLDFENLFSDPAPHSGITPAFYKAISFVYAFQMPGFSFSDETVLPDAD
jgi:hypothetical protein